MKGLQCPILTLTLITYPVVERFIESPLMAYCQVLGYITVLLEDKFGDRRIITKLRIRWVPCFKGIWGRMMEQNT